VLASFGAFELPLFLITVPRLFPRFGLDQRQSKSVASVMLVLGVVFCGYLAAQLVLADDWKVAALAALGFGTLAFAIRILNDWRQGLYIFFGWLFFEDFARKYLGNNMAVFFAKDVLVLLVYISFFAAKRRRKDIAAFRPRFLLPLLLMVWFAVGQVFNPASTSVFYGFLGLKLYFLYVPLMYLGYALIDSETELRRFFIFNSVLLLIVGGLGIAQAIIGPTFLNPATLQEDIRELSTLYRVSPITGLAAYRPSSVFVSTGRFQNLIVSSSVILMGFAGYLILRSKKGRLIAFTTTGVLAAAAVMSTSRGVVTWCAGSVLVIVGAFLWGAPWKQRETTRVIRSLQRVALLGGLAIVLLAVVFPKEVGSRFAIYSETLNPYSPASELVRRAHTYPLQNFLYAFSTDRWPYGYGTGTASLGTQYVARILHAPRTGVGVENGYGQLVVEMGVIGLLLWIILGISICSAAWRVTKSLRSSPWFPLAFVIFWFLFLIFFPIGYNSMAFYQDFLVNAYAWILLGILFRLPKLALSASFTPASLAASKPSPAQRAFSTPQPASASGATALGKP
jgi:hypothetical protein